MALEVTAPRPVPENLVAEAGRSAGGAASQSPTAGPSRPVLADSPPVIDDRGPAAPAPAPAPVPRRAPVALVEPEPADDPLAPAGQRLLAGLIDMVLVSLGSAPTLADPLVHWATEGVPTAPSRVRFLPILVSLVLVLLDMVLVSAYFVYGWGVKGATPGKKAMGLAVQGTDGTEPIGVARAGVRLLGYMISGGLLGAGFVMALVTGYGLHDRMSDTRVVSKRP
jgi:uncharacterized RDD family membrane protein YckC